MISKKSIEDVLATARVEDVIEDFVNLKRRGSNMMGLCPFHHEKTPSFVVSPGKNLFKCFGCGKGGDAVRFIMEHESLSYPEAIRYLAAKYNIQLEETAVSQEDLAIKQLSDVYYIINEFATKYFQKKLWEDRDGRAIALSYFKERGFLDNTIQKFQLGYSTAGWDEFTKTAIEANYNPDHLKSLGLSTQKDHDFFRSRVIFPIHNLSGKVIAFAGRILGADKNQPKYLNSPESEIYNKRKTLYGLYFAKNAVRKEDECILVEGYTDVISLHQAGVENVVASSGTSLTEDQTRLIRRYTQNIKVLYDSDPAGIKAALRGLDIILAQDMNVKLALLPQGEDPDSFIKAKGKEAFDQYLKQNEKDFVFFKVSLLAEEAGNDPIKLAGVLKDIISSIALIPDSIKRELYIRESARLLQMDERLLHQELTKQLNQLAKQRKIEASRQQLENERQQIVVGDNPSTDGYMDQKQEDPAVNTMHDEIFLERELTRLLFNYGDQIYDNEDGLYLSEFLYINVEDEIDEFIDPVCKVIFAELKRAMDSSESYNKTTYLHHENLAVQDMYVNLISTPFQYAKWEEKGVMLQTQKMPEENYIKEANQCVLRFKLKRLNRLIRQLKDQLFSADSQLNEEDRLINIKSLQEFIRQRNEIASDLNQTVLT